MGRFRSCLALVVCLAASALADGRLDCSAVDSKILRVPVRYCVLLPDGYDANASTRYPILYFLHGLGDNERSLVNMGAWTIVNTLRREKKIGEFLIVTPEAGRSFYVNSVDGRVRFSDFFLAEFVPSIERKYRVKPGRSGRAISGLSMGGYGALRFAFLHPEMFVAVSAESPALLSGSPKNLNAAMRSGHPIAQILAGPFGSPIDVAHWQQNDPFVLAKKNAAAIRRMAIAYNCGDHDDYGFDAGSQALDRQLTVEGIRHRFDLYEGGHTLTYFLSHLGEILEFHWRAFSPAGGNSGPR